MGTQRGRDAGLLGRPLYCQLVDVIGACKISIVLEPFFQLGKLRVVVGTQIAVLEHITDEDVVLEPPNQTVGPRELSRLLRREDVAIQFHVVRRQHRGRGDGLGRRSVDRGQAASSSKQEGSKLLQCIPSQGKRVCCPRDYRSGKSKLFQF